MERGTRVAVFESELIAEINLIKSKLENKGIPCFTQNAYMSFMTTPTANTIRVQVNLEDETKAFEIIDAYLQEREANIGDNTEN